MKWRHGWLAALALSAGCAFPAPNHHHDSCGSGMLFIGWTIDGKAPSTASCAGIDHLIVTITSSCGKETIDPVPCNLDQFHYADIDIGDDSVELLGVDGQGASKLYGSVSDDNITVQAPASAVRIALGPT